MFNENKQFLLTVLSHKFFKQREVVSLALLKKLREMNFKDLLGISSHYGNRTIIQALTVFYTMFEVTGVSSLIQA